MRLAPHLRLLLAPLLLAACANTPDPAIRDLRPTQIERGDTITVEASAPVFTVGAPTQVVFDQVDNNAKPSAPISIAARAINPTRVLFEADALAPLVGAHRFVHTTVTVHQTVDNKPLAWRSSPTGPFELNLFPASLNNVSQRLSDKVSGGSLWAWLGMTVEPAQANGTAAVKVTHVDARFDRGAIARYDTPPLDGQISKKEAHVGEPGGMSAAAFDHLDKNHDGTIQSYELEDVNETDGEAQKAGLRDGDVITAANGLPVATPQQLAAAWEGGRETYVSLAVLHPGVAPAPATPATVQLPRFGRPLEIPPWLIWALCMALVAGLIAIPVPVIGGLIVVWERKISAYMQSRIGPNRVGPGGWLQWLADGLKLILKEDLIPTAADPILFKLSPFLAFVGLFLVMMVLPFTGWVIVADLNIGLLFLLSVTSLVVVSIIMGGWSSNSKWSLLGGMRSAAQIISYELPASVALLGVATLTGSLSTEAIVRAQGGLPWEWYLFRNPFLFVAFFIYFISALAEGNRTPFDLPEAESELVAGYNTEYSGFRFALFPLVEWVNLFVIGAVAGMLFCGGWQVPGVSPDTVDRHGWLQALGFLLYLGKIIFFIFVTIWIRWTLPRFRVDQMMNLCWKYFIPISFACFVGTLMWAWLLPDVIQKWSPVLWFILLGCAPGFVFLKRVQFNRSRYKELNLNPLR